MKSRHLLLLLGLMGLVAAGCPPIDAGRGAPDAASDAVPDASAGDTPTDASAGDTPTDASAGDTSTGCATDSDCAPGKMCDPSSKACVGCVADADCPSGLCHPQLGACVSCVADAHCADGVCDPDGNQCVQCLQDADCPAGVCDLAANVCGGCGADSGCDDDNPCTTDRCLGDGTCQHTPDGGAACDDGDPCTVGDFCEDGSCHSGGQDPGCGCPGAPTCEGGLVGVDDDGDGCHDRCTAQCESACDCYDAGLEFEGPCLLACATCDNHWTCEDDLCKAECGQVPDEVKACEACESNADCGEGTYCARAPGACDALGQCQPQPEACPDIYDPVCGCDGATYGNECEAHATGVNVASEGACTSTTTCGGIAGVPCGAGEFCELPAGSCDVADAQGTCVEQPEVCTKIYQPVCGCDGKTWANDCMRQFAGVQKAHDGECDTEIVCGSSLDVACPEGEFCQLPSGSCGGDMQTGTCELPPAACPDIYDPVCGCDGATYGNECEAHAAGVNVASEGACTSTTTCGGIAGVPCGAGEFCELPAGSCDVADAQGTCVEQPEVCTKIYQPVCGCDGKTWANDCLRRVAGAQKAHDGVCDASGCTSHEECGTGSYCHKPAGQCGGEGQCAPLEEICPLILVPVCGCDGVTYDNECKAHAAGVNVASEGECTSTTTCGGIAGVPCAKGEFCELPAGSCDVADAQGTCVAVTLACPEIYDPVCGCDGGTYSNDCFRRAAKAQKAHDGACKFAPEK